MKGSGNVGAGGTESKREVDSAGAVGSRETAIVMVADTTKMAEDLEKIQMAQAGTPRSSMKAPAQERPHHIRSGPGSRKEGARNRMVQEDSSS